MDEVQVEQTDYHMPPQQGFTAALFLTVTDIERSVRFYQTVFGGKVLRKSLKGPDDPAYVQIANTWLIFNPGGGPTPDKPGVTLKTPDPNVINSFMNLRVADIVACYDLWRSRGATFLTEPKEKYGETRCYIRDPDGYIIEVGQSKPGFFDQPLVTQRTGSGVEAFVRSVPVTAAGRREVEEMPDWAEQVDAARAIFEHRMRGIKMAHLIAFFVEDDDRRIGAPVGVFGVDVARKRRSVVGEQAQAVPSPMRSPRLQLIERGARGDHQVRALRDVGDDAVEAVDP